MAEADQKFDIANSDSETEPGRLVIKADFDADEAKVIDICDDIDENIKHFME